MTKPTTLTDKYDRALLYASDAHRSQFRKGTTIPYLSHLMVVSALVLEAGGDEDMAIAGLLHDAAEDQGGQKRLTDIEARFGPRAAAIVAKCSDSLHEDSTQKAPWPERKAEYLKHLNAVNMQDALERDYVLVCTADKLHNAQAILRDFRNCNERGVADEFWLRFTKDGEKTEQEIVGLYLLLSEVLNVHLSGAHRDRKALGRELHETVQALIRESNIVPNTDWAKGNPRERSIEDIEKRKRIAKALRELREMRDASPPAPKGSFARARKALRK